MTEAVERLRGMLKGIRIAMLTTQGAEGQLRSRPMATQELDEDGVLWFCTGKSTSKVEEIARNQEVNLSYVSESDERYVSVSGTAEPVDDEGKLEALWNPLLKAWFPQGLEDPDLTLLRVKVDHVEYWDVTSGKLVQLAGFVKAVLTGTPAKGGTYERLDVPH